MWVHCGRDRPTDRPRLKRAWDFWKRAPRRRRLCRRRRLGARRQFTGSVCFRRARQGPDYIISSGGMGVVEESIDGAKAP
jgi:hypothetical protein